MNHYKVAAFVFLWSLEQAIAPVVPQGCVKLSHLSAMQYENGFKCDPQEARVTKITKR